MRAGKRGLVQVRLKRVLERDHQLDAFERREPEFFDRRARLQLPGPVACATSAASRSPPATGPPVSRRRGSIRGLLRA